MTRILWRDGSDGACIWLAADDWHGLHVCAAIGDRGPRGSWETRPGFLGIGRRSVEDCMDLAVEWIEPARRRYERQKAVFARAVERARLTRQPERVR